MMSFSVIGRPSIVFICEIEVITDCFVANWKEGIFYVKREDSFLSFVNILVEGLYNYYRGQELMMINRIMNHDLLTCCLCCPLSSLRKS